MPRKQLPLRAIGIAIELYLSGNAREGEQRQIKSTLTRSRLYSFWSLAASQAVDLFIHSSQGESYVSYS